MPRSEGINECNLIDGNERKCLSTSNEVKRLNRLAEEKDDAQAMGTVADKDMVKLLVRVFDFLSFLGCWGLRYRHTIDMCKVYLIT